MEVADTEAAVTLVGATSAAVTSPEGPMCTSAGAMCTLVGPTCTLAGLASPEAAATLGATDAVAAAVGLAGIGVMAAMVPATRTGAFIRRATGRSELKPIGVLNVHLALQESSRLFASVPGR
jgi:hypothetical protein